VALPRYVRASLGAFPALLLPLFKFNIFIYYLLQFTKKSSYHYYSQQSLQHSYNLLTKTNYFELYIYFILFDHPGKAWMTCGRSPHHGGEAAMTSELRSDHYYYNHCAVIIYIYIYIYIHILMDILSYFL
jgi:hypothetical protein